MTMSSLKVKSLAIAAIVFVVFAAALFGSGAVFGGSDEATVYADFTDASPLIVGNDVKVDGVKVGQISSIKVKNGLARVGLNLEKAGLPVHTDARATVKPVSLLGERFVDFSRGTASKATLPMGSVLPVAQTGSATDLDQVLNAVDRPTGQALAAFITTMGDGMNGNGKNIDKAVKALQPAFNNTAEVAKILDQQSSVLTNLIDSLQPLAGALATDNGKSLDGLVGSADQLLKVTADRQKNLDAALKQLPGTLAAAERTLGLLKNTADATTPTLANMRPTSDNLVAISAELSKFSDAAEPALGALDPVLVQAKKLIDQAQPVVASLKKSAPDLNSTVRSSRPVAVALQDNMKNVLDFVRFWALSTNGEDGLANYFRAQVVVIPDTLTGLVPGAGDAVKLPNIGTPGANNPLADLQLPGLLGNLLGGGAKTSDPANKTTPKPPPGSATGLSEKQENSLMDYLLGGLG